MKNRILLTIVIPVYNVERYIRQCLDSVFSQIENNKDVEVIVVNDGTPDNSMLIVNEFAENNNFRIINQENKGLSAARNAGLKVAKGDYVWFVDSDDMIAPDGLDYVMNAIDSHYGTDCFASILLQKKEKSGKTFIEFNPNKEYKNSHEYLFDKYNIGACQRYVLRRQFLWKNDLWFMEGVYHEDAEFSPRLLYKAKSFVMLQRPVYIYLLRGEGSIMSTRKPKMNYDLIKIYNSLDKFCSNEVRTEDFWNFKFRIFECLKCTILFSRNEIFANDFKIFYHKYRRLIKKESLKLIKHSNIIGYRKTIEALHFYLVPLFYTKLKHAVKVILIELHILN